MQKKALWVLLTVIVVFAVAGIINSENYTSDLKNTVSSIYNIFSYTYN